MVSRNLFCKIQDGWIKYLAEEPTARPHSKGKSQEENPYDRLSERNLVQSKYALVLHSSDSKQEPPLVVLRSWGYASAAERLHVIGFTPSSAPMVLLDKELDLSEVADLDGDGNVEIVGRPCLSEVIGNFVTYDPLHVYKIPHPMTSPATLDLKLSEAYNLKHYFGWAGPDCSGNGELVVVEHPVGGGKPVILPQAEAEKLLRR